MKILEEFQHVANAWSVPLEAMVVTYAEKEGLAAWWIRSSIGNGFKYPEFVMEALEFSRGWWLRREFDEMDYSCSYIFDPDHVDLGPYNFRMSFKDFMDYYTVLWNSEYAENPSTVNVLGVDYRYIASKQVNRQQRYTPETQWRAPVTFDSFLGGAVLNDASQVRSLREGDKFVAYNQLRRMMFEGFNIYDETQREIIKRLLNNKEDVIRLLRNMK